MSQLLHAGIIAGGLQLAALVALKLILLVITPPRPYRPKFIRNATFYVGGLARRLDAANRSLIEVKHQLQAGESLSVIGKTVEKVEERLGYSGDASLVYAGYPFDPFRPDKSVH
jgi:hypothetical protein